jgi:hypothetical protein
MCHHPDIKATNPHALTPQEVLKRVREQEEKEVKEETPDG